MSNQYLKLRRSSVPGKIPDTGSLDFGELAINTYDGLVFMKKSGSLGEQVISIGGGSTTSGSFTGSFSGSFTGSLQGTASYAINALTASYLSGYVSPFPYTGNAVITGSLDIKSSGSASPLSIYNPSNAKTFEITSTGKFTVSRPSGDSGQTVNVYSNQDGSDGMYFQNDSSGGNAGIQLLMGNNRVSTGGSGYFQIYKGSSNNGIIADGTLIAEYGLGGIRMTSIGNGTPATAGPISFAIGGYDISNEIAWFNHPSYLSAFTAKNNINILSGSLRVFNGNVNVTGSIIATNGITGSLQGTASWAINSSTSSYADNFTVAGTITAQKLVVQTITSSVLYSSGSNIFGNDISNVQSFTGSLRVTGSGNHYVMGGNVGIGTTVPSANLHISSTGLTASDLALRIRNSANTNDLFTVTGNGGFSSFKGGTVDTYINSNTTINGTGRFLVLNATGSSSPWGIILRGGGTGETGRLVSDDGSGNLILQNSWLNYGMAFNTSGSNTRMFITGTGNVGIGTNTPNATLDISGSINISGSGTTIPFQITSGSTSLMYISSSGQMGIGTSTPAFRVQVSMPVGTDNFAITSGGNTLRFSGNIGSGNPGIASSGVIHFQSPINGTGGTEILQVRKAGGANFIQYWSSNAGITLSAIDGTGRLGIGTGTMIPSASIHIKGATSSSLSSSLLVQNLNLSSSLVVLDNGFVGIGTSTPSSSIHVRSTTNNGTVISTLDNSTKKIIEITDRGTTTAYAYNSTNVIYELGYAFQFDSGILKLNNQGSNGIYLAGAPNTSNFILNNIGIRTTTPNATLDVSGSVNISGSTFTMFNNVAAYSGFTLNSNQTSTMYVGAQSVYGQIKADTANVWVGSYTPGTTTRLGYSGSAGGATYLNFSTNGANTGLHITHNGGSDLMTVTSAGNVGIGNATPNAKLDVNGNTIITGSLTVTARITGSITSASYAATASYADNFTVAGTITAQKLVVQTITSSIIYSSGSNIFGNSLSNTQVFTGSMNITGSLNITGSINTTGTLLVNNSLLINQTSSSLASGTTILSNIATGSYTSAFYNYTLASGSNARSGQVMIVWNGGSIQYTDNSTLDIGNTAAVVFTASLSGANMNLTTILPSDSWTVKTLANLL
jgi:hypothetical protein